MKPNFKNIDIKSVGFTPTNVSEWIEKNEIKANWLTPEQIPAKSVYQKKILRGWSI